MSCDPQWIEVKQCHACSVKSCANSFVDARLSCDPDKIIRNFKSINCCPDEQYAEHSCQTKFVDDDCSNGVPGSKNQRT